MQLTASIPQLAPAVGPYSLAAQSGSLLFCSGQLPIDPATGKIEAPDAPAQAAQVLANVRTLLAAHNATLQQVVKSTLFLQDMADFAAVNAVYADAFGDHKPARSTIQVAALPLAARVELEVIVELNSH